MAPISYHYHLSDRSLRWSYPNLLHPSTLCRMLIPKWVMGITPWETRWLSMVIYQLAQRCVLSHTAPESRLTEPLAKEDQLG